MKKRLLSAALVLCIALNLLPMEAFAAEDAMLTEPKVTQLTVSYDGGESVDLLGDQPTVSLPAGSKPVFTVSFDSTELLNQVFVTSTKDGETTYLEAKPQGAQYITDGYFDPSDTDYIPGTIAVTYSKKSVKVDESGNVGGMDLSTLKTQLSSQGISIRNESEADDGTVTAEIVLSAMSSGMADVYVDAAISQFTAGAGVQQDELNRWLGVYQNLSELSSYDVESADGKKFTLYLSDKDLGDTDTYLVMVKDATSNKYTKMLISKAADSLGLGDISNAMRQANLISGKLLEYNAISKDTAALREEIAAHPTMTDAEKAEANAKIDALDRDKKLFLMGMTAIPFIVNPVGAPLMISALLAGYSSIADYFWDYRVGMIQGSDPIEDAFTESSDHPGWIELDSRSIDESGNYYLSSDQNILQISDNAKVTLCLHGHTIKGVVTMKEGATLHICDCKYKEHSDGSVTGGMISRTISMKGQNELTLEQGVIQGNYGHAVACEGSNCKITVNGGMIEGVNGAIIADDGGNGEITINGGILKSSGSMDTGIRVNDGSKLTINDGMLNSKNAITTYDANGNSNATIQINGGVIVGSSRTNTGHITINMKSGSITGNIAGGIITFKKGSCVGTVNGNEVTISSGQIDGLVYGTNVILLINGNTDIQVSGSSAFSKAPVIKADAGYTGGVTYYSSANAQGTPMTIEEAATVNYTRSYVRLVANGAVSGGNITVTPSTSGNVTYTPSNPTDGDTVTITVTPETGYQGGTPVVKDASGNSVSVTDAGNGKYTFVMPAGNVTITPAEFTPIIYNVTAPVSTPNGSVTLSATTAKKGDTVTITVTPDASYQGGAPTVTDADGNTITVTDKSSGKYSFVMPASNVTITPAAFTPISYTVTAPASTSNGTVTLSATTATKGSTVTITVSPNDCYKADTPVVTGSSGSVTVTKVSDTTYTFTMPGENVAVSVSFVSTLALAYTPYASMTDADKKLYYGGKLEITGLVPNTKYIVTFDNGLAAPTKVNGRDVIPRIAHVVTSDASGKIILGCQDSMNVMVFGVSSGGNVTTDLVELYAKNHAGVPVKSLASATGSGT